MHKILRRRESIPRSDDLLCAMSGRVGSLKAKNSRVLPVRRHSGGCTKYLSTTKAVT